jgi:hypothetical protein
VTRAASRFTAFAFLLASAACEANLAEREAFNADGTWAGRTNQAGAGTPENLSAPGYFSLTVSDNRIRQVTFTVSHGDACEGMFGVVADVDEGLRADRSFELSGPAGSPPFTVTGTFVSINSASGSLTAAHSGIVCASASTVRWTATR